MASKYETILEAIYPDGTREIFYYEDELKLQMMYDIIGNNCSMVYPLPFTKDILWYDDDGKVGEWEVNFPATQEWADIAQDDYPVWEIDVCAGTIVKVIKGDV